MASDDLRARIDAAIRPNMLFGLQDAELHDEPGKERINEWADWISRRVADLVQAELDSERELSQSLFEQRKQMAAERYVWQERGDRYRAAWRSARRRAADRRLAGERLPGGAIRQALIDAGIITAEDRVADAVEKIGRLRDLSDDAWGSVWLHGKWSWLTKNMTTEQREYAADCVARWSARLEPDEPSELEGLRWWRESEQPACTCRGLPMGAGQTCNAHTMKEPER